MLKVESGGIVVLPPKPELELEIVLSFLHNLFPPIDNQNRHVSSALNPPPTPTPHPAPFQLPVDYHNAFYCQNLISYSGKL